MRNSVSDIGICHIHMILRCTDHAVIGIPDRPILFGWDFNRGHERDMSQNTLQGQDRGDGTGQRGQRGSARLNPH